MSTVCTGTIEYIITSITVALWLYSVNCMHCAQQSISSHPLLVALWLYSVNCMHWHNRVYHHIHYSSHYGCIVSTVCTGTMSISSHPLQSHYGCIVSTVCTVHNRVYHHIHYLSHYGCIVSTVCTGTTEYIITSITCTMAL